MRKIFHHDICYCKTPARALEVAEGCLIMTEWDEFRLMAKKVVIDGRKMIGPKRLSTDIDYEGIYR